MMRSEASRTERVGDLVLTSSGLVAVTTLLAAASDRHQESSERTEISMLGGELHVVHTFPTQRILRRPFSKWFQVLLAR